MFEACPLPPESVLGGGAGAVTDWTGAAVGAPIIPIPFKPLNFAVAELETILSRMGPDTLSRLAAYVRAPPEEAEAASIALLNRVMFPLENEDYLAKGIAVVRRWRPFMSQVDMNRLLIWLGIVFQSRSSAPN